PTPTRPGPRRRQRNHNPKRWLWRGDRGRRTSTWRPDFLCRDCGGRTPLSRIHVTHIECGGPAVGDDDIHPDHPPAFMTEQAFSLTCLTCLEEITDPAELVASEILSQ